jgi:hypothetical protein
MRARPTVVAAAALPVALTAVLLAGCGSGVRHGPVAPVRTTPNCGSKVITPGAVGATREVCLTAGSTLTLRLGKGRQATEKGAALTEVSPGVYRGARAGTAALSGFGRVCPTANSGAMACDAIARWTITVDVR